MSYTARQLFSVAEDYYDEDIDDIVIIDAINRAMGLIGENGMYFKIKEITALNTLNFYQTDEKCLHIEQVWPVISDGINYHGGAPGNAPFYYDYQSYDPRMIRFNDLSTFNTFNVLIKCLPDEISNFDDPIDLHPIFKQPLISYIIGFAKCRDDDTNPDGQKNMEQDFVQQVILAARSISKKYTPNKVKVYRSR